MEKEKTKTEKETKERKNFNLSKKGLEENFLVEVINKTGKNFKTTMLGAKLTDTYVKQIRLENDQKGLILANGSHRKYVGVLVEGVSAETGKSYIALDIMIDDLYRIRDFLTWAERIILFKTGFLVESKQG